MATTESETSLFGFRMASHAINLSKGLTAPVLFGLLVLTQNFQVGPLVYATIHGLYGVLWVLKQAVFPDKNFVKLPSEVLGFNLGIDLHNENPLVEHFLFWLVFVSTSTYWAGGISLILSGQDVPPATVALAVALFSFGVFVHFGSDIQKFERLKYKKGLIMDGFWRFCRSPGYFGEMLIYSSFFVMCPLGWPLAMSMSVMLFGVPMFIIGKERSISRHPEYAEYKTRTALLIPFLF